MDCGLVKQQESELDKALREAEGQKRQAQPPPTPDIASLKAGAVTLRLIDISMDSLVAAGASNQREEEMFNLQGGGHDPRKRGFTVQNIELSLAAAVDPYLTAETHLIYLLDPEAGESVFELEEVFATTTALPWGFQLEMGHFFTEFGRINPQHPHQWDFQDQPVINTRLFGPDGLRGPGFRLGWLTPLPFFSELHFGMQNANGETMASFFGSDELFEERPTGGRQFVEQDVRSFSDLLYHLRANASHDLTDDITAVFGVSGLLGPNATGPEADTQIYGIDLKVKWRPAENFRGWPFVVWQTEFMLRRYEAAAQDFDPDGVPASGDEFSVDRETLRDHGFYTFVLYGFSYGWVAGLRFERADSGGASIDPATGVDVTDADPFRDRRTRISSSIGWHPTEFSRVRLQYNLDKADHLDATDDDIGHSVWLGIEFFFGAHAAHKY
ncbi:MAG: hypothetical protein HY716_05910 [Planctomycetes bacterium]|nr:hypothetical protein [Planctomycetota bacterium]